ncbi:virulence factor SrfB [Serratia rubidaea]|uniref:virulence factor SrfB n=1 Tax=Serratia rubidaea TaxID=61652 RepID=UPI0020112BF4|nr:virulence factor SrfB [Serratia rubidaea]
MLATLPHYPAQVTLVQNSGVQFLDFGLPPEETTPALPGAYVRKTANGPLLQLRFDPASGKHLLNHDDGAPPETVRPELRLPFERSLALLAEQWLPLPFFRFSQAGGFLNGPANWARMSFTPLTQPDEDGCLWRITLAFDTQRQETDPPALRCSAWLNPQKVSTGLPSTR